MNEIKRMKLYTHVERIANELAELGYGADAPLRVDELSALDQLHYHGTDALDTALHWLDARPAQHWLEIGSGIGGPARYLAHRSGLRITALELQADQNALAESLTRRCGLEASVRHCHGDFLEYDFGAQRFDAIVSWLALYHIPERARLLRLCHNLLAPGACFYAEDLFARDRIPAKQRVELERDLYAITLPGFEDYQADLESAGFEIERCVDMSDDWAAFTHARLSAYRREAERHRRVHGDVTVRALDDFYSAVDRHFQSGKLGGLRIQARRGG